MPERLRLYVNTPIGFKFYVSDPGVRDQSYGNYADSAIFQFLPFFSGQFSNAISSEVPSQFTSNFM